MRTLQETEEGLRPFVTGALLVLMAAGTVLVAAGWDVAEGGEEKATVACAGMVWLVACCLTLVNVVRARHPSIGSVPPLLCALAPSAAICAVLATGTARALGLVCLVAALPTLVFLAFWISRMWVACHVTPEVAADAVIICLGGAVRDARPLPTLRSRLDACLELAREEEGRTVVCSGGLVHGEDVGEAEVMRDYLVARGLDGRRVLVEDAARTTRENIERSVALVREAGVAGELCVCSSDYHVLRALSEGRRCGVELKAIPARTPAPSCIEQWCREALTCAYHGVRTR